jgi:hypothetical protein
MVIHIEFKVFTTRFDALELKQWLQPRVLQAFTTHALLQPAALVWAGAVP